MHSSKLEGYFATIECGGKVRWTNGNKCIEGAMIACKMEAIQRACCAQTREVRKPPSPDAKKWAHEIAGLVDGIFNKSVQSLGVPLPG